MLAVRLSTRPSGAFLCCSLLPCTHPFPSKYVHLLNPPVTQTIFIHLRCSEHKVTSSLAAKSGSTARVLTSSPWFFLPGIDIFECLGFNHELDTFYRKLTTHAMLISEFPEGTVL